MLTHVPNPSWRQWRSMWLVRDAALKSSLHPWAIGTLTGGLLSRSMWSIALIAQWRRRPDKSENIRVFVPDYFCEYSLTVLRQSGVDIEFYVVKSDMSVDLVALREQCSAKKPDVILEEKCPTCESNLVLKTGRFGEFTACGNYPACKYVKQKTIGVKCPECSEGDIVERRSKRGKTFYGCHRYPDCEFVGWAKPVVEPCPECGSPYMTEKFLKSGAFLVCPNAECKYKKDMPVTEEVAITV